VKTKKLLYACWLLATAAFCLGPVGASAQAANYVIANDDQAFPGTSLTLYRVETTGALTLHKRVATGGSGVGGGYFGANRLAVLNVKSEKCIFISEAATGDIVGVPLGTLLPGQGAKGSPADGGTSNGIGLALNDQYLYASFSDSNTIGTFLLQSHCSLTFVNDTAVSGLLGGVVNGMSVHGLVLVATYTDGTIESFDLASGPPISRGDKQLTTATRMSQGATYANSVDITSDGHYAIFGDTSTSLSVEVSDLSSGSLLKTRVYQSPAGISSSNVLLSPDETLLYVTNTQGGSVTVMFFDHRTGKLAYGCTSSRLRGLSGRWSYLGELAPIAESGDGGGVYVAEFGSTSGVAMLKLALAGGSCSLVEASGSPFADPNSGGLLSIGRFPPRSF
jgi:hypothetical protein